MAETSLPVEHLYSLTLATGASAILQGAPQGTRVVVPITGGTVKGKRINGQVLPDAAGDWVTVRADGSVRLDVRMTIKTDDGAMILVTYNGIGPAGPAPRQVRAAPIFETGDERYAWLNQVQGVGVGSSSGGEVHYEVYALK